MTPSKLKDYKLKKGKFISPLNEIMTSLEDDKSWTYGRLPEYLWIGLIMDYYGRDEGFKRMHDILVMTIKESIELKTLRISEIIKLDDVKKKSFFENVAKIIQNVALAPLTLVFTVSEYPEFVKKFHDGSDIETRKEVLERVMSKLMSHQTNEATDIRFLVLYYSMMLGRMHMLQDQVEKLQLYPYISHDDVRMQMIRPLIRASDMILLEMVEVNKEYLDLFWAEVSTVTDCKLYTIKFPAEENNGREYLEIIHEIMSYFNDLYVAACLLDNKMKVLISIATYSYKRFKEAVEHELFNCIAGRSIIRVIIEEYIMMKYLVKKEQEKPNIWQEFEMYGIGQYKLILAKHREFGLNRESHVDSNYLETLVNEFKIEESIDMDTSYFGNQNIRIKAEEVGEKSLYGLYYDYDSAFEHGLWGAIRESSMLKCNNPAHQYHCVPDIDDECNLKSILGDCVFVLNKIMLFLDEQYGMPTELKERMIEFEERFVKRQNESTSE